MIFCSRRPCSASFWFPPLWSSPWERAPTGALPEKHRRIPPLRTSLSYVSEKLRQADSEGALSIGTVRDSISLALKQEYRGESYTTYIYEFDGSLCELFIRSDASAEPEYGTRLLELSDFQVERLADALYRVSIVTEDGKNASLLLHPHSRDALEEEAES